MDYDQISKIDLDYALAIVSGEIMEYFGYDPFNVKQGDQLLLFHDKIVEELVYYKNTFESVKKRG